MWCVLAIFGGLLCDFLQDWDSGWSLEFVNKVGMVVGARLRVRG